MRMRQVAGGSAGRGWRAAALERRAPHALKGEPSQRVAHPTPQGRRRHSEGTQREGRMPRCGAREPLLPRRAARPKAWRRFPAALRPAPFRSCCALGAESSAKGNGVTSVVLDPYHLPPCACSRGRGAGGGGHKCSASSRSLDCVGVDRARAESSRAPQRDAQQHTLLASGERVTPAVPATRARAAAAPRALKTSTLLLSASTMYRTQRRGAPHFATRRPLRVIGLRTRVTHAR